MNYSNTSKTQHEDCQKNEFKKKIRMMQKALNNYNKYGRGYQGKKLAELDFQKLKPFYQEIKDPYKTFGKLEPKTHAYQLKSTKLDFNNCILK